MGGKEISVTDCFEHKVDARGRVFIPSSLREELGESFHVIILNEDCINAYSDESWRRFMDKVESLSIRKQPKMRPIFANASKCELDSQGRFLLPQKLRERVGINKDVTVVGVGTLVQIWDTGKFNKVNEEESTLESLNALLDELDF